MLNIPFRRRPLIEELEPRLLYSADLAPLALDGVQPAPEQRVVNEAGEFSSTTTAARHELVIVDTGVENYQTLIDDILKQTGNRRIEVVVLDTNRDGIEQITEILGQHNDLDALHIISHGDSGELQLGSGTLDSVSLNARAEELAIWKAAFSEHADILLYGCDVASGETGQSFIHTLAELTGADLAASEDATGSATLGGDWVLEQQSGSIETSLLVSPSGQERWNGLLGDEFQVNTTTPGDQNTDALNRGSQNAVAYDALGNFVVVWSSANQVEDGDGYGVYARRFDAGGNALTGEILVNVTKLGDQQFASVASDSDGNFVVTWTTDGVSGTGVVMRRFAAGGTPLTGEIIVNTTTVGAQRNSVIAMNSNWGDFVIAWEGAGTGDSEGIFFRRYSANGTPIDASERPAGTIEGTSEQNPAVAMNSQGHFVIAHESGNHIYFQRFNSGGIAQGSPVQGDSNVANVSDAAIAMDDSGNFTIVYRSEYILGPGIWGRSFDDQGVETKTVFLIGLGGQNGAIAMASDGAFIVTYDTAGVDGRDIYAQKYHADGSANGGTFLINQYTSGNQDSASIAMRDANNFVVVWSGKDDTNATGVGARLFNPANTAPVITTNGGGDTASLVVNENTTSVTTVTASDAESQPIAYSISGTDAGRFNINQTTGDLSFRAAPDYENPLDADGDNVYEVIVEVIDGYGGSDSQALSVAVSDQAIVSLSVIGSATVQAGSAYTLTLAADEDATAWTVNWGDGTISHYAGNPGTVSHTYTRAGFTFNILASATDASGTVHNSQLLVPTYGSGDSVMRFAPMTGAHLQTFANHGSTTNSIQAVVGPDGQLYVTQEGQNTVRHYDTATGALIGTFVAAGSGGLSSPGGLAFGPDGHLYVASYGSNQVLRYDGATGAFIDALVPSVAQPYGLTFGADGRLYVGLYTGDAVARYDATSGALVDTFVTAGSGGLKEPEQLTFGPDGHLYVASYNSNEVLRYDGSTGNFMGAFVAAGAGGLHKPSGVSFGPDGALYVSSLGTDSILRYDGSTGAYLGAYVAAGTGGLVDPTMMTFVPQQQVQVLPAANQAPVNTVPGAQSALEDTSTAIAGLSVSDADQGGGYAAHELATTALSVSNGALQVTLAGSATIATGANGSAALTLAGSQSDINATLATLRYQGNADYVGGDTLVMTSRDSSGLTDTDTVAITVTDVNDAPTITGVTASTAINDTGTATAFSGVVIGDVDSPAQTQTVSITLDLAAKGSLSNLGGGSYNAGTGVYSFSGTAAAATTAVQGLVFTPTANRVAPGSTETTSFTLSVSDGVAPAVTDNATTVVTTSVNDAPVALDDSAVTDEDTPVTINVVANDTDAEGSALTVSTVTQGTNGTVTFAGGSVTYTPNAHFNGSDSFTYTAFDGTLNSNTVAVTVTVTPVNDAPTTADVNASGAEDVTSIAITLSGSDVDGTVDHFHLTTLPANGTLYIDAGLTLAAATGTNYAASAQTLTLYFVPAANWNGTTSFQYESVDAQDLQDATPATATITVNPVNDAPVANGDSYTITEDTTLTAVLGVNDLLNNDSDIDLDSLTVNTTPVTNVVNGSLTLYSDGTFTYTPNTNFTGTDSFTYEVSDGNGDTAQATVSITINSVNDTPIASGIANVGVNEDAANTVLDLFAAFADAEDTDALLVYTVTANTNPGLFSASLIDGVAGTLTLVYVPNASGSASITVRATDTGGLWVESTFDVTVNPVNDAPTLAMGSLTVAQGETIILDSSKLSASDEDNTISELTYVVTALPAEGTLALNGGALAVNGTFTQADIDAGLVTYTHTSASASPDSFGIKVIDPASAETPGVLAIAISAPPPDLAEAGAPMPEPEPAPEPTAESPASESETVAEEAPATTGDLLTGPVTEDEDDKEKTSGFFEEDGENSFAEAYRRASTLNPVQIVFNSYLLQNGASATTPLLTTLNRALDAIASDMNALESLKTSLGNDSFQQQLNQLQEDIRQQLSLDKNTVASTLAVSTGLSVGYVLWLVRGGVLLSSLLSTLPAWRLIDPLPILGHLNRQKRGDDDDDSLEGMLKKSANKPKPQPVDQHTS